MGRPVLVHEPTSHAAERSRPTPAQGRARRRRSCRRRRSRCPARSSPSGPASAPASAWRTSTATQRRRFDVLMDGDKPVGNRWNYDEENRESPPKRQATLEVPKPYQPREDDVDERGPARSRSDGAALVVGNDGPRLFAVTADEAKRALDRFIEHRLPTFGPLRGRDHGQTGRCRTRCCPCRSTSGCCTRWTPCDAAEDAHRPGAVPIAGRRRGVRPAGARVARVHVASVLALRARLHAQQQPARPDPLPNWWRELDADAVTAECLRHALMGSGPRLDPPHPAAHGPRQPRAAARLSTRRADGLVRDGLRRRLPVGDADQRRSG